MAVAARSSRGSAARMSAVARSAASGMSSGASASATCDGSITSHKAPSAARSGANTGAVGPPKANAPGRAIVVTFPVTPARPSSSTSRSIRSRSVPRPEASVPRVPHRTSVVGSALAADPGSTAM